MGENINQPVPDDQKIMQMAPGDSFILCYVPVGTKDLKILSDGNRSNLEYAAMALGALNIMIQQAVQKEQSRIVRPVPGIVKG